MESQRKLNDKVADLLETATPDAVTIFILRVFTLLNILFVTLILWMGVACTFRGVREFFGWAAENQQHTAIASLMDGLEFYLLAPLGYILLRTLGNYIYAIRMDRRGYADPESAAALMSVKGLTTGLLIAVLATHLVALFLERRGEPHLQKTTVQHVETQGEQQLPVERPFPGLEIGYGALLMLVLVAYFALIEYFCHRHPAKPNDDKLPSAPQTPLKHQPAIRPVEKWESLKEQMKRSLERN